MPLSQVLFSTKGRIPRSTYWFYGLAVFGIMLVLGFIDIAVGTYNRSTNIGTFQLIFEVLCIIPGLAVGIKRCHDRNRSGWFLLVSLIPLVNLWVVVELAFLRGTVGDNEYGPDPAEMAAVRTNA